MRVLTPPELIVRVLPELDDDQEHTAALARRLQTELLDLDVHAVHPMPDDVAPEEAKGIGDVVGVLAVWTGKTMLTAIMAKVRDWASRTDGTVEVTIDGDTIKVIGKTSARQDQLIDAWLARHALDS